MRKLLAAVAVLGLAAAGCSGIPTSSEPEVVTPVRLPAVTASATISPIPGADPQTIVSQFLDANASSDPRHSAARAFLTPDAQRRWSDASVTVVADSLKVGGSSPTITVSANRIGTVDQDGIYTPDLHGDGTSGDPLTVQFEMSQVNQQWRIDQLPSGLIVTQSQFAQLYRQQRVYFLDSSETRLVPDLRYSALADRNELSTWLLTQLAAGPRPYLQNAVQDEVPAQTDPTRVTAAVHGSAVRVDIPGSSQLDQRTVLLLAAQLSATLGQAVPSAVITLADAGRPVALPGHPDGVSDTDFTSMQPLAMASPSDLFFLHDSTLQTVAGDHAQTVPGALGHPVDGISAVALAYRGSLNYLVAATVGTPDASRLLVGHIGDAALSDAGLPTGPLTKPVWASAAQPAEVWVASGATVYRVPIGARAPSTVTLTAHNATLTGTIGAIAFSVDGARVALTVSPAPGRSQVWVGAVVRSGNEARVDGLQPVSPPDVEVTDLAWNDPTTLFVTGVNHLTSEFGIWDVQSDGSLWKGRDATGIPSAPSAITAAIDAFPVVQADGRLWQQRRSTWTSLYGPPETPDDGTSPTYLQ